jgi:thymidylate kinase
MTTIRNIAGLIIEGVCGSGKSTVLRELAQSAQFQSRPGLSTIVLSEHQTQRVLESKERSDGLKPADNIDLLDQHVKYLEDLNDRLVQMPWAENGRSNMRLAYIFERFHLTHVSHYEHISWEDVQEIDNRLSRLHCKAILLTADRAVLEQRTISGRDSDWRKYIERFGESDTEILDHYVSQQSLLQTLCDKSKLDTLAVDTSEIDIETALNCIIKHWGIA